METEAQSKANATTGSALFSKDALDAEDGGEPPAPAVVVDLSVMTGRAAFRTGILGYRCEKWVSKIASASILFEYKI